MRYSVASLYGEVRRSHLSKCDRVHINPFKTRIYKNDDGETILSLYADDMDSGEWESFSNLTSNSIKQICES